MLTATLPDQVESLLPFGRHRGASHWVAAWLGFILLVPLSLQSRPSAHFARTLGSAVRGWHAGGLLVGTVVFGLALGPFLHVLLDGCSDAGVPVAPFSRQRLKLGLYRTHNFRWRWDFSELLFLCLLLAGCAVFWRIHR